MRETLLNGARQAMRLTKVKCTALAAVIAVLTGMSGPLSAVSQESGAASVIEEITERGVLRVGMSIFVPWAMRDRQGGLIGFEIDVANKVAEDMGVEAEFVPTDWPMIIPALIERKFDVIISGMSVTPSRSLEVSFTRAYAQSGQQIVASSALASGFALEDFDAEGVVIACRRGATTCDVAEDSFPKAQVARFDDDRQAIQEVVSGKAHAMIASTPRPGFWVARNPGQLFMPAEDYLTGSNEAFAIRKGDPDALDFFNNWIDVNASNGFLKERHDYWFKTQDWTDLVGEQ